MTRLKLGEDVKPLSEFRAKNGSGLCSSINEAPYVVVFPQNMTEFSTIHCMNLSQLHSPEMDMRRVRPCRTIGAVIPKWKI